MNSAPQFTKSPSRSHPPGRGSVRLDPLDHLRHDWLAILAPSGVRQPKLAIFTLSLVLCGMLTGCFGFLKPAHSTARHFVLTPISTNQPAASASNNLSVGIARVRLPAYLLDSSLAVRKGENEIEYLPSALWAERLDAGLQRALAQNLAVLLPADQIRLSLWGRDEVTAEVYVTIEQLDVSVTGAGTLVARWRVMTPGAGKTVRAGESRLAQSGPTPEENPSGAIATLSHLIADLSRQIAQAVKDASGSAARTSPGPTPGSSPPS